MLPPTVCELKQNRDTVHSQVSRLHASASVFVSLPDRKLQHILFCFSFKQLHPQGVWSLITAAHLPQPTGGRPRIRPATVPCPLTQQQRRHCRTHYSGSAATHKESAATASIITDSRCHFLTRQLNITNVSAATTASRRRGERRARARGAITTAACCRGPSKAASESKLPSVRPGTAPAVASLRF